VPGREEGIKESGKKKNRRMLDQKCEEIFGPNHFPCPYKRMISNFLSEQLKIIFFIFKFLPNAKKKKKIIYSN